MPLTLDPVTRAGGLVVWADRSTSFALTGSSRIRDLSRVAQSTGTEIPIVREHDFRPEVMLPNIPAHDGFRTMLRVWSTDDAQSAVVRTEVDGQQLDWLSVPLSRPSPDGLPFGSADLTPMVHKHSSHGVISLSIVGAARAWGMVSITNNDTQEVTVVTPQ